MSMQSMERNFRQDVSRQLRLARDGENRFRVFTPFRFDDGDHLAIVLKREGTRWVLSDEAHTCMHLGYDLGEPDGRPGAKQSNVHDILLRFGLEDRDGELVLEIQDERYRDALFALVQELVELGSAITHQRTGA